RAIAMRHELVALRRGDFRMLSAERGTGLIVYWRSCESGTVTVAINGGAEDACLSSNLGQVYWESGLRENQLASSGFAVFSSCKS
ncbi:MAG: DUF3459 domain-containing protein, partial [Lachnospiraceae bacterium]|nr:DUF3459 domain-containing protein [Lachnospiraceae bacterium]